MEHRRLLRQQEYEEEQLQAKLRRQNNKPKRNSSTHWADRMVGSEAYNHETILSPNTREAKRISDELRELDELLHRRRKLVR